MKTIEKMYQERHLPPVWDDAEETWEDRRRAILQLLCENEYGFLPRTHDNLTWRTVTEDPGFCAGKVTLRKVMLTAGFGKDSFSFPIYASIPNRSGKHPFFVFINFDDHVPSLLMPAEEICDRSYAVISFCYSDVSADRSPADSEDDRADLSEILFRGVRKERSHCGKIAMWAWAASRALDYAESLDCLELSHAVVAGHSRLGKASLLAGALDDRFACTVSNDSGGSGAALSRGNRGETIKNITEQFGYWFCDKYQEYADKVEDMPFDQHFLLAAMAPRMVYVASAAEDAWADPVSEFLSCAAASTVYEKMGLKGLETPDRLPEPGTCLHDGRIGYHMRGGTHFFSREDWNKIMDYLDNLWCVHAPVDSPLSVK